MKPLLQFCLGNTRLGSTAQGATPTTPNTPSRGMFSLEFVCCVRKSLSSHYFLLIIFSSIHYFKQICNQLCFLCKFAVWNIFTKFVFQSNKNMTSGPKTVTPRKLVLICRNSQLEISQINTSSNGPSQSFPILKFVYIRPLFLKSGETLSAWS